MTKRKLYGLDLFSGIGGNTLGLGDYIRTVAYCEQDRHAQSVLLSRMGDGSIPVAPIWDDITTLGKVSIDLPIDIIVGGFPCQDISQAGHGKGLEGERSGLFYEIVRLAKEFNPTFLFLENVANIRTKGMDTVLQELTEAGYDCRWTMLSARDVGAPQIRERWFLLAYSKGISSGGEVRDVPGTNAAIERPQSEHQEKLRKPFAADRWSSESNLVRVANGVPNRVDRLKRLGNAVVPEQAKQAFEILMGIK